jgi:hypothetical protein
MRRQQQISVSACVLLLTAFWPAALPAAEGATTNLFARVSANGVLLAGSEVTGVTGSGGVYEVTFSSDVSGCAYVATTVNAGAQALQAYTAGGHLSPNGVYVEVKNQGGGVTPGAFHLAVVCGSKQMRYAVVGYDGNLARATDGTTLVQLGGGVYQVTFTQSVKTCAYLATVGDPGTGLVFAPGGVYTGSGPNTRTVYIETKNPGGGVSAGIPFHLAVVCPTARDTYGIVANASGLAVRGSSLTSTFNFQPGRYALVAPVLNSTQCATIATRGSVDKAAPFAPATAEITGGFASNTVGIEMRELLAFGGAPLQAAFHAVSFCR